MERALEWECKPEHTGESAEPSVAAEAAEEAQGIEVDYFARVLKPALVVFYFHIVCDNISSRSVPHVWISGRILVCISSASFHNRDWYKPRTSSHLAFAFPFRHGFRFVVLLL